jgi:MFS family permease
MTTDVSLREKPAQSWRFMLRALGHRNYRLFFGGQLVSLIGTWLSSVASSWLVYRLAVAEGHPAPLLLGLVGFASQFPVFLLTPLAGVWVDRWNRHRILIGTQTMAMLQSFTLAGLTLAGVITLWQVLLLMLVQGIINSLDMPSRQALVIELVESRDDLANAIALNSSMVHSARLFGPAIAGYLIYRVGEGYCFLIDGCSYLAVIGALLRMKLPAFSPPVAITRPLAAFREGLAYAFGFPPIRTLLVLVALMSMTAMSQTTLMPIFAAKILGGEEQTLGWLLGASGFGALVGSLYLASRRTVLGLGRVIAIGCVVVGAALIGFALSRWLLLSLALLAISGGALVMLMAAANTILQTIVDDDKRGRVMALFSMAFLGMAPLGSLAGGAIATLLGAPIAIGMAGTICFLVGGWFAFGLPQMRFLVRPIYRTKGVLPPVADVPEVAVSLIAQEPLHPH